MPGENLTRDEARERAQLLAVDRYDVVLDLTTGDETFRSDTTIHVHRRARRQHLHRPHRAPRQRRSRSTALSSTVGASTAPASS